MYPEIRPIIYGQFYFRFSQTGVSPGQLFVENVSCAAEGQDYFLEIFVEFFENIGCESKEIDLSADNECGIM